MGPPGLLNWWDEVSRHSQVTETVMSYSPQCDSIRTSQGSIPSRPCPANPQANNYANTKIFACAINELTF
jgi:hypothetical protein